MLYLMHLQHILEDTQSTFVFRTLAHHNITTFTLFPMIIFL